MRILSVAAVMLVLFTPPVGAEGDRMRLADRMIKSDGDSRCAFALNVGSMAASSPYDVCGGTDTRAHRTSLVVNPSATYGLMVGTFSAFAVGDVHFQIPPSSGSWSTSNHQRFWLRYPPGASSETVRGNIESE